MVSIGREVYKKLVSSNRQKLTIGIAAFALLLSTAFAADPPATTNTAAAPAAVKPVLADSKKHDVRLVFGKLIDLGPLLDWYDVPPKDRHERPLPPWHECHIDDIMIPLNNNDQCMLATDHGVVKAYIYNLDYSIRTPFVTRYYMNQQIAQLDRSIANDRRVAAGPANSAQARAEHDAANHRIQDSLRQRGDCVQKLNAANAMIPKAKNVMFFAINSGSTMADPSNGQRLEVWDCGLKKTIAGVQTATGPH
jgi:hypothetical protein